MCGASGSLVALDEAEGGAVLVGHCGDERAADVPWLSGERGAGLLDLGECGVEVGNEDVRDRCGHALLVTLGRERDLDAPDVEPDVVGLVGVGFGAE